MLCLQSALRTVQYMNTARVSQSPRTVTFTVSDGYSHSESRSLTVYVEEFNDVPIIQLDTSPLNFDGSLLTLQPALNISDEDDSSISSASVTITTGCTSTDVLQLSGPQVLQLLINTNKVAGFSISSFNLLSSGIVHLMV